MNVDALETTPGLSEVTDRPAPSMDGRSVSSANAPNSGDMMLEAEFQRMLDRERSRPSLLWDDRPFTNAPPEQPSPKEDPGAYGGQMYNYLQTLEQDRQTLLEANRQMQQAAQEQARNAAYYQQLYQQTAQSSPTGGSAPAKSSSTSSETDIRFDVARTRLLAEAMDLEKQYPGFNRQEVAQYARLKGYRTLSDAWRNMMGEASLAAYQQQVTQQQAYEQAQYQQYIQWQQQQQQAAQQRAYQQQYPQMAPAQYAGAIEPPPASNAVVMRSGARTSGMDPLDARKPTSWNEVAALSMHDARRVFGPTI